MPYGLLFRLDASIWIPPQVMEAPQVIDPYYGVIESKYLKYAAL